MTVVHDEREVRRLLAAASALLCYPEQATVDRLPGIKMSPLEATYLAWLDVRALNLPNPHAHFEAHGLGLSDGADFGAPGWLRLNFGCTEATLDLALQRLETAWRAATA